MAHSALRCHHPTDRSRTHALITAWTWVGPDEDLATASKTPYAERKFILAPMGIAATRADFKEALSRVLAPEEMPGHDKMYSDERINELNHLSTFHPDYRRVPTALVALYAKNSTPIVFCSATAVYINPHLLPYPIDDDWFAHFKEDAAAPNALVWHEHFVNQLHRLGLHDKFQMDNEKFIKQLGRTGKLAAVMALMDAHEKECDREDIYLEEKKKQEDAKAKDNAKKKARKLRAKQPEEAGSEVATGTGQSV